jgi:NADH-quinone oxidoreductase subunit L
MAGEQDMRRMGGLQRYLPVTYATMFIGTLAIAGIAPFSGFFSKDEILYQAFLRNKAIWIIAVATALMTAFYMFRLIYMTFAGSYRGPAWEAAGHAPVAAPRDRAKDIRLAATHGTPHPADAHAHGQAHRDDHEVTHGPAEPHDDSDASGHGHGPWHGPHESPTPMTFPLMALAVGAVVAGFFGVPAALGGGNAIEQFLEPSFSIADRGMRIADSGVRIADSGVRIADSGADSRPAQSEIRAPQSSIRSPQSPIRNEEHSRGTELGLMVFSLAIAFVGWALAHKFYVTSPEIADQLAERWSGAHRTLQHKYYVDELYNATVVAGTYVSGGLLWLFDRRVVDGAVNGTGWLTIVGSWFSGLTDKHLVDGAVNLVARACEEASFGFRKLQTGLVQNYALLMLFGVFAFVSIYLFVR